MKTVLVFVTLLISAILSAQDIRQMDLRLTNDSAEFYKIITKISITIPQDASGCFEPGIGHCQFAYNKLKSNCHEEAFI